MLNKLYRYFINYVKLWSVGSFYPVSSLMVACYGIWMTLCDLVGHFVFCRFFIRHLGGEFGWAEAYNSCRLVSAIQSDRLELDLVVVCLSCTALHVFLPFFAQGLLGSCSFSVVWGWLPSRQLKVLKDFILKFKTDKIWFRLEQIMQNPNPM